MLSVAKPRAGARWFTSAAVAVISLAVAFSCIGGAGGPGSVGGSDWDNYLWAARTALAGHNPYLEWARAMATLPVGNWPGRADLPPLQLLIYMGCLRLGGPPVLFVLFAVAHAITAVLIDQLGIRYRRPGLSLLAWFWAAFPLVTYWFYQQASNKNIMTLLAVTIVLCAGSADRHRRLGDGRRSGSRTWLALLVATFLGNFGWLGFAAVPMVILSSCWPVRKMLWGFVSAGLATVLLHLPYAPDWKVMYSFRFSRVAARSFHTSPLQFLDLLFATWGLRVPLQLPLLFAVTLALCIFAYKRPGNAAKASAMAMITMAMVRTDADPPTALMSLFIAVVALQGARHYVYLSVAALLFYSHFTTAYAGYGTLFYTFDTLVPLLLPVGLLVREIVREGAAVPGGTGPIPRAPGVSLP